MIQEFSSEDINTAVSIMIQQEKEEAENVPLKLMSGSSETQMIFMNAESECEPQEEVTVM